MYAPIIGTLGYVISPDGNDVLLVYRNARMDDQHLGKYNGLGGKMLPGEAILGCMKREIQEEAGIECIEMQMRGTINWPRFGPQGEDWLGFIFRIDTFSGIPFEHNNEGTLGWHPVDKMMELPMWEGDRFFLPMVFDHDSRPFHGWMPYEDGKPVDWKYERM